MFNGLWPDLAVDDVPIGSITNGVHGRTWVSARVDALLTRVVGEDWPGADATRWARVRDVDPLEAWTALNDGRDELVRLARQRLGEDVLDPTVLTIGFARRFATYKRATLLLSDPERLCELLLDRERPVQFVFAGKAHPADTPGKELIQRIEQFARSAEVRHRFVFLADYDISIARTMYHGCDVWLNTPRRPLEACGTSGMKAALNGALNCSILDGWWDECYDGTNGWAIESADDDPDLDRRDLREVGSLFAILENQVVPKFYDRGRDGVPRQWVQMVLQAWASLGPQVTASRMVRDYTTALYEPAAASARHLAADGAAAAIALADWRRRVDDGWKAVAVTSVELDDSETQAGTTRTVTVAVELGELTVDDVAGRGRARPARPRRRVPRARRDRPRCNRPAAACSPGEIADRRGRLLRRVGAAPSRCTPISPARSTSAASPGPSDHRLGKSDSLHLVELDDGEGEQSEAEGEDDAELDEDRDLPPEPLDRWIERVERRLWRVEVAEHLGADGVHGVGHRVEQGEHLQPPRQIVERVQRPGQERERQQEQLHHAHHRLDLLHPRGDHQADGAQGERQQEQLADEDDDHLDVVRHPDGGGEGEDDQALPGGHGGPTERLADEDRAAPDRRHEHLSQEPELAVPHDRRRRERRREQHRRCQHTGEHERLEVDAAGRLGRERRQPGAEDEQEQHRLHERGDGTEAVLAEADQLALPHHLHAA